MGVENDIALRALLEEATCARLLEAAWQRAEALCRVATGVARLGAMYHARSLWEEAAVAACAGERVAEAADRHDCSVVLAQIAIELARAGDLDAAMRVAGAIALGAKRDRALGEVRALAKRAKRP